MACLSNYFTDANRPGTVKWVFIIQALVGNSWSAIRRHLLAITLASTPVQRHVDLLHFFSLPRHLRWPFLTTLHTECRRVVFGLGRRLHGLTEHAPSMLAKDLPDGQWHDLWMLLRTGGYSIDGLSVYLYHSLRCSFG